MQYFRHCIIKKLLTIHYLQDALAKTVRSDWNFMLHMMILLGSCRPAERDDDADCIAIYPIWHFHKCSRWNLTFCTAQFYNGNNSSTLLELIISLIFCPSYIFFPSSFFIHQSLQYWIKFPLSYSALLFFFFLPFLPISFGNILILDPHPLLGQVPILTGHNNK